MPWAIVISRIAPTMFSVAIVSAAYAASSTVSPSGSATVGVDRCARRVRVELQPPAEEVVGVDPAERDGRVGHGRARAAPPVAGRPGVGPGALRARRGGARPESIQTIEPPPAPIDFTSTERMPVMWPIQRPPSQVSAV